MKLREALKEILNEEEQKIVRTSFDVVGDIAIIEIPEELESKETEIGETLLGLKKNIKVVCKKVGNHYGPFRRQKLAVIAGENRKETVYRELAVNLEVDVEMCYFSPRLSTERKRIMQMVKPGERILVMFSGVAPYPVVLARNTEALEIVGVELNPVAHEYGLKNVEKNKRKNVKLYNGDVREIVPTLGKFDRILMPLPKDASDFLDIAMSAIDKGIVHVYDFRNEAEFEDAKKHVLDVCEKLGRKCEILRLVKCGQHAPRVFRICIDVLVKD